tara:strand:+ start:5399 stop:6346 length:948 start_codon:yes stop_codon:yes gene_type:complete
MIEIRNLTKRYGSFLAVDDISFNVEQGKILGFLGPNGAGKTTTMRIVTGFMPATNGTIEVSGYNVQNDPIEVKRRIGYLPETPPLYVDMTVEEYLGFAAKIKQISSREVTNKINLACEKVAITDVKKKVIKTLSKGYKQRVGLAQAIIHDPEVLILDEPTIGLDPIQIREVRELIKSLAGNHTIVLSTHILPEVGMTCDEVVIIRKGKIIAKDTPDGLARSLQGSEKMTVVVEGPLDDICSVVNETKGVSEILDSYSGNGQTSLILKCDFKHHVRQALSRSFSEKDWSLLEMKVEEATLEDVFIRMMSESEGAKS